MDAVVLGSLDETFIAPTSIEPALLNFQAAGR